MNSPQTTLLAGSFGELQEQRQALAAIVGPIEAKLKFTQGLADHRGKLLADTRAVLNGQGPADYDTPLPELARRVLRRLT